MDDLRAEFEKCTKQKLPAFHEKLAKLNFFDPACGCGNFLVIAYREIRRIENDVINDPLHKTYPILSKYEKTRVIGLRVSQLNKGAQPFVTLNKVILDNVLIAEKELREKKIPFIIMRPIPNGISEYWNINDLEHI